MTAQTALPHTKVLRDILLDTLSRDIHVAPSEPWAPTLREPGAVAVYVDDSWRARALISSSLTLSVALAASLDLVPAKVATSCIEAGQLTDDLADNLNEVLDTLSAMFNRPDRPHLRLFAVHLPGSPPPADISVQLRAFGRRADLKVEVAGYGCGRLSLVLC